MSTADAEAGAERGVVLVIDDDPSIRSGLDNLLRSVGLDVRCFASVAEFEHAGRPDRPACLVLDVRMPGRSGLEFQRQLAQAGDALPIIFLTAHGDVPMTVRAMKGGAIEFLTKPFNEQVLIDAIHAGLALAQDRERSATLARALQERYAMLNERERDVMRLAVAGRLNKQIAADLGLSEITIKVCRSQVMRKMQADSFADLVRMAEKLEDGHDPRSPA